MWVFPKAWFSPHQLRVILSPRYFRSSVLWASICVFHWAYSCNKITEHKVSGEKSQTWCAAVPMYFQTVPLHKEITKRFCLSFKSAARQTSFYVTRLMARRDTYKPSSLPKTNRVWEYVKAWAWSPAGTEDFLPSTPLSSPALFSPPSFLLSFLCFPSSLCQPLVLSSCPLLLSSSPPFLSPSPPPSPGLWLSRISHSPVSCLLMSDALDNDWAEFLWFHYSRFCT